ncbi:MAG: HPF/RaiA family ribosome-associated protein, partial [Coprobacillus sp.]
MKVIVRGKNVELTEGIEAKINKKLNMLDKYFIMSDNVEA